MKRKTKHIMRMLGILLVIALVMGLMPQMALTAEADPVESYGLWVGGTRVTSNNASNIPAKVSANKTEGTASYNAETKTLTLDNYKYSGDCEDVYYKWNNTDTYDCHTVIFVNDSNIVSTIIIKGNVSLIQSDSSSSPYGLTYLVSDSKLTIKGEGENPKLTVSSGNSNGSGGGASNGIYIYGSHLHIKDCAVEATGGNGNTECSGIFANKITLENSTLTASCNNTSTGSYAKGYGIRIWDNGKLTIDNKSTVTVIGNTKAVNGGTVVNSGAGTGWNNVNMPAGEGTSIEVNTTGAAYDYKAMKFLPPPHTHSFRYSASGATITATCSADGCGLTDKKATLTIVSPTRTTYGGTGDAAATLTGLTNFNTATNKTVAVGDIKYAGRDGTTYSESTIAPTDAGKYTAKITVEEKTASVDYEIAKASETAPNSDTTQLNINYTAETISAKDGYEVAGDGSGTSISNFSDILDSNTPTVYIRKTATDNNHDSSAWVAVTLAARPAAPNGLGSTNSTNETSADGTITNVNDTMEYSANGTTWTPVPSTETTITGLNPGTYSVRVKATESAPHGVATTVTVGSNYIALTEANKPTISVSDSHNPPVVDDTLTASTTATDIVYEWYRDGEKIPSATASTYTLTADDVGKPITVKVTQTKQADGTDYTEDSKPTQTSDATAAVVKKSSPVAPANEAAASFVINYSEETFTVDDAYEVSTTNSDTGLITNGSLTDAIDGTGKIYIRAKETGDTQPGAWLEVTLPSRPGKPTGLTKENATDGSSKDGKIIGTTADMEYSPDHGTTWIAASSQETTVAAGTYLVRVKATGTAPHGEATEVTVGSKEIILSDDQKPTAKSDLTYTGSEQALINAPTAVLPEGATEIRYALGTDATTAPTDGWSTSIPTGTDAKTYYVWYKVIADTEHNDSDPVCIKVVIQPAAYAVLKMENTEYTIGSGKKAVITVTRSVEDNRTFSLYTGSSMDGKPIASGNCDTAPGSLVLTLKAYYLDSLSVGDHKLTISFKDGSVDTTVKILPVPPTSTAAPTATPKPVPKTGDTTNPALWLGLILLGLIGAAGTVLVSVRKK